jgi:hypothetical protein
MILSHMVRSEAKTHLTKTLETVPGALREVLEQQRFDYFVRECTVKCNELELYTLSQGVARWDWADFVRKCSIHYARSVLNAMEHRVMKSVNP